MGISSRTKFVLDNFKDNAFASYLENEIGIGELCFDIEAFVHEVNELELMEIFTNLGLNRHATFKDGHLVTHLISPYGKNSLLYPFKFKRRNLHKLK